MKKSNCGNCPHIHRCYATNDDECIDTIIGKKHYISEHDKQIRAETIDECIEKLLTESITCFSDVIATLEELKE